MIRRHDLTIVRFSESFQIFGKLGTPRFTKMDEFSENFQTASEPLSPFRKTMLRYLLKGGSKIKLFSEFIRKGGGSLAECEISLSEKAEIFGFLCKGGVGGLFQKGFIINSLVFSPKC